MSEEPNEKLNLDIDAEIVGKIEILVEKGLYDNTTDFFENAIEKQLSIHKATFEKYEKKTTTVFGILNFSAEGLNKYVQKKRKLEIKVIGSLRFGKDVTPELVEASISKIFLAGRLSAPDDVIPYLNKKRHTFLGKPYSKFKKLKD